jgi:multidrug efflux system membrane fusion protein
VVPASVVQRGPEGAFVFVIKEDQKVDIRPVKVAQIEQGEALIDEGLNPGERVVVDGQYKLQKGSTVKTADSPTSRPGSQPGGRGPKPAGAGQPRGGSAP